MELTDCILLTCFFLVEEVDPPPANPPNMVFIVSRSREGSVGTISVQAWTLSLWSSYCWWLPLGMAFAESRWLVGLGLG